MQPPADGSPYQPALRVEGWRGVNHSYALVNQHQLLHLARMPGLRLSHRDMPYAFGHWNAQRNSPGFADADAAVIAGIATADGEAPDAIFRICAPYRGGEPGERVRTATFMATELGLSRANFEVQPPDLGFFTRDDNLVITPSHWARARIVEYGMPAERVHVVAHGVDSAAFHPVSPAERAASRANLGIGEDETVFLNVGVAVWNKGIDLVLRGFAQLRRQGLRVRLILKDQRDVYGVGVDDLVKALIPSCPGLADAATIGAISIIPGNLNTLQLRQLFGVADCYVSPYRAEGFNLPVLEAIACGVPVIVSGGGATDDFCDDDVAWRLASTPGSRDDPRTGELCRFVEPVFEDLVAAMTAFARHMRPDGARMAAGRARVLRRFTWGRAAGEVARLTVGGKVAGGATGEGGVELDGGELAVAA